MKAAIDTDVMIDALRRGAPRHSDAVGFLRLLIKLGHIGILSPIVAHELYTGVYSALDVEKALRGLERTFERYRLEVAPYTLETSKIAGRKAAVYLTKTKSVQLLERKRMDIMVGSHARAIADCLITWNKSDYREVGYMDLLTLTPREFSSMHGKP